MDGNGEVVGGELVERNTPQSEILYPLGFLLDFGWRVTCDSKLDCE